MKTRFALAAAFGLAAAGLTAVSSTRADDDISKQFTVTATQSKGKVEIVIKPANDKVFINSEYALKIHLEGKDGGKVDKADLSKDDGKYDKSTHEGKALKVTFNVGADKGVKGEGKVVVCSLEACGNPTKFNFESK
jgi:uncharacterized membrane protein YkoI